MAKRESIWRAADGTEHKSRQSASVADAEQAIRDWVYMQQPPTVGDDETRISAGVIIRGTAVLVVLLNDLVKARAALAKHAAKGDQ